MALLVALGLQTACNSSDDPDSDPHQIEFNKFLGPWEVTESSHPNNERYYEIGAIWEFTDEASTDFKGTVIYSYPGTNVSGIEGAEIWEIGNIKIGGTGGPYKYDYQFSGNELRLTDISVPNGLSFTFVKK